MRLILFLVAFLILFFLYYTNYMKTNDIQVIEGEVKQALNPIDYAKKNMGATLDSSKDLQEKLEKATK